MAFFFRLPVKIPSEAWSLFTSIFSRWPVTDTRISPAWSVTFATASTAGQHQPEQHERSDSRHVRLI